MGHLRAIMNINKMNKLIVITTFVCLRGLTACSDSNPTPPPVPETAICLEGAIGASTRGIIGSGYEQELKVSFARQDESAVSTDTYSGWAVHEAVRQGGRGNRPIVFAESQSYPEHSHKLSLSPNTKEAFPLLLPVPREEDSLPDCIRTAGYRQHCCIKSPYHYYSVSSRKCLSDSWFW